MMNNEQLSYALSNMAFGKNWNEQVLSTLQQSKFLDKSDKHLLKLYSLGYHWESKFHDIQQISINLLNRKGL